MVLSAEKFAVTEYTTTCSDGSGSDVTPEVAVAVAAPLRSMRGGRTRTRTGARQQRRRRVS